MQSSDSDEWGGVGYECSVSEMAPGWKAGVAKVDITPLVPVYMSGYGNRAPVAPTPPPLVRFCSR